MGTHGRHLRGIDGLRAIAVLAVVAYHAGLPIPAGFVGVDVFFVISGFLITRLLQAELAATGRIDLADFYARRARRILPALLTVILVTVAVAFLLLPDAERQQASKAAAAAALFGANIFFASGDAGYFEPATHTNPLLHLWSIGVEEQFYLAWPLLLWLARKRTLAVMIAVAVASFILAEGLLQAGMHRAAFYQTPPRAWELAIGGIIAVARVPASRRAGLLGLGLIVLACFIPLPRFPGSGALMAVAGAALVIAATQAGHRLAMLEARPMVAVGVASYSLYLWHWPIMVLGVELPVWLQVVASFALAWLSYAVIEQPFRRRFVKPARETVRAAIAGIICTCSAAMVGGLLMRPPPEGADGIMPIYALDCDGWYLSARLKPCTFGSYFADHTAVLVGDSVVMQWFPAVRRLYGAENWRVVVLTKSSCPMIDAPYHYPLIGRVFTECEEWRDRALSWIEDARPDVVITGSSNNYGFDASTWTAGSKAVLSRVASASDTVVLLRATPMLTPGGSEPYDDQWRWERQAVSGLSNIIPVDLNDTVCPEGTCERSIDGQPRFRDSRHLHAEFAESLTDALRDRIAAGR